MIRISGKDNDRIKQLLRVRNDPRKSGMIFVEGVRVVKDAFISGMVFESLFVTEERLDDIPEEILGSVEEVCIVTGDAEAKISQTRNPQGIFALLKAPLTLSADLDIMAGARRLLICDGISDPGNMGSIIRSADAFGFDGVAVSPDCVSPYNDKVLRSSAGSVFHIRIFEIPSLKDSLRKLKEAGFTIYAGSLEGEPLSIGTVFDLPCCIIIGNEGSGISGVCADLADRLVRIPMTGRAESLNAAVAASLMAFMCMETKT